MPTLVLHKLPSELLYVIALDIIGDSIHSVGLGRGTEWDVGVFTNLANISPRLEGVVRKLAASIFGLYEQDNRQSNIPKADCLMRELNQLSQPMRWDAIVDKYPDKYPSDIFKAYSLLNSAISLRHSSLNNPVNVFIMAQDLALSTLKKMNFDQISTVEIASVLKLRYFLEKKILMESTKLVSTCNQITSLLAALPPPNLAQSQWQLVSQIDPTSYEELCRLLVIVEGAAVSYESACVQAGETQNAKKLPGFEEAIGKVFHLLQHTNCDALQTASIKNILSCLEKATGPVFIFPNCQTSTTPLTQ